MRRNRTWWVRNFKTSDDLACLRDTYLRTSDVLARGACDVSPHTRTHDTDHPWGGSSLAARRSQPSSLAVSRLTVNAVKDLNGGASLGFLGQELRPVSMR